MDHERELDELKKREAQLRKQMKTRDDLRSTRARVKQLERGLDESRIARFGRAVGRGAQKADAFMVKAAKQYEKAQKSKQPAQRKRKRAAVQQGSIFGPF